MIHDTFKDNTTKNITKLLIVIDVISRCKKEDYSCGFYVKLLVTNQVYQN